MQQLDKTTAKTEGTFKKFAKNFLGPASIVAGLTAAGAAVVRFGRQSIQAASDAEETANRFNTVFRDISGDAEAAAENLSDNFGVSRRAAQDLLAATGDLLTGFGFTQEAALDLSDQANQLAIDLASFTNVPIEQSARAITSALTGETEALKSLGIVVRQGTDDFRRQVQVLQQSEGITEAQARAQVILQEAYEQSGNAIGDFERSSESLANTQRQTEAAVENLSSSVGRLLLPVTREINAAFGDLVSQLDSVITAALDFRDLGDQLSGALGSGDFDALNATLNQTQAQLAAARDEVEAVQAQIDDRNFFTTQARLTLLAQQRAAAQQRIELLTAAEARIQQEIAALGEEARLESERRSEASREALENAQREAEEAERLRILIAARDEAQAEYNAELRQTATLLNLGFISEEQAQSQGEAAGRRFAEALIDLGYDGVGQTIGDELIRGVAESLGDAEELSEEVARFEEQIANDLLQQTGDRIAILEAERDARLAIAESLGVDTLGIEQFYAEEIRRVREQQLEEAEQNFEELKAAAIQSFQDIAASFSSVFSSLNTIGDNFNTAEIQRLQAVVDATEEGTDARVAAERRLERAQRRAARDAAIRRKALGLTEVAIATAVNIAEAFPDPFLIGSAIAVGGLQAAAIASEPLPTAQFGGSFVVPPGNNGDSGLLRVNSGERVTVTPSNQNSTMMLPDRIIVQIGDAQFDARVANAFNRGSAQIRRRGAIAV